MARSPKHLLGALPLLAAWACVPTAPEKFVRGGAALTLAPSEATVGIPFTSVDGWTVTLEKTALRAAGQSISANATWGGTGDTHIIDPRYLCELRVTGLPPGPAGVAVQLMTSSAQYNDGIEDEGCQVDDATLRRFADVADDADLTRWEGQDYPYPFAEGPSVYFVGRAEKAGRTLRFDLALAVRGGPSDLFNIGDDGSWSPSAETLKNNIVTIEPNKGVPMRFEVHFEAIFAGGIQPLADADTNGDGVASAEELRAVKLDCTSTSPYPPYDPGDGDGDDDDDSSSEYPYDPGTFEPSCVTLLSLLNTQAMTILGGEPVLQTGR